MTEDKVFAGYFEPLKVWNDSTKKYEEFDGSVAGKFNFTINELDDLKKYATTPNDPEKQGRVYFELKTSRKGGLYAQVSDPKTWKKKETATATSTSDDLPF